VIGDTTNVAARLASVGQPGEVVVSDGTWAALAEGTDGASLGPTRVKGKTAPVDAWVLRGLS
jgi:adenylate cyclase